MYAPVRRFYNALQLVEVSHTDVTCFDGSNGSITVSATGGKAPYQYSMDESFSTYNTDGVFSGLSITGPVVDGEDEYGGTVECTKTVYVRDAKSNVTSLDVTVKSPVELDWLNVPQNITVYCDEGEDYATVVFEPPIVSTTSNRNQGDESDYIDISGVSQDNHYEIGTNSISYIAVNDCNEYVEEHFVITVLEGTPLTLTEDTTAHQNVTCFDGSNGSVTVIANGGESPYIYSQDPSFETYNSTGVFDNLSITGPITEGTDEYGGIITCTKTFYVKDANNVVSSVDVELSSPVELAWLNCPSDITVYCDEGEDYATVVIGIGDNVDIVEPLLSTTANITNPRWISDNRNRQNRYTLSNSPYTVTFSARNSCSSEILTCSFHITVLPRILPNAIHDYDGNWYDAVIIGDQVWTASNLRTTHYADGMAIPVGGSNSSETDPYYYDYSSSNIPLKDRGYLYNWPAVMNGAASSNLNPSGVQGIAPTGWHVPSDAEWTQLTNYVGSVPEYILNNNSSYIAKSLASQSYWNASTNAYAVGNDLTANNKTLFGAVPAGYRDGSSFYYAGNGVYFWSATQNANNTANAYYHYLYYSLASVYGGSSNKNFGSPVRCICDLSPLDFAAWYYQQYGSYNHQIS